MTEQLGGARIIFNQVENRIEDGIRETIVMLANGLPQPAERLIPIAAVRVDYANDGRGALLESAVANGFESLALSTLKGVDARERGCRSQILRMYVTRQIFGRAPFFLAGQRHGELAPR
ncbi:MAG TPA: hypothetical protein VM120_09810 [Bryobacteraceae bacterium]|nr:hypothetical protein [Bryobacteraceae bacterium]